MDKRKFISALSRSLIDLGTGNSFVSVDSDKVKLLDRNGKLVEVDKSLIERCSKRKVGDEELKQWINK